MAPRFCDLLRLSVHHSAPRLREMGKQGWQQAQWQGKWHKGSSSWESWHSQGKDQQGKGSVWDGYQSVDLQAASSKDTSTTPVKKEDAAADKGSLSTTQVVQRAVNAARRADQRLKQTLEKLSNCQRKWQCYQKQLKELFIQQQEAYNKDVELLEAEATRHQDAADLAEMKLKAVLSGDSNQQIVDAVMHADGDDMPDPWEQLVADARDASSVAALDRRLAQSLQCLATQEAPTDRPVSTTTTTPNTRTSGGLPTTRLAVWFLHL